MNDVEITTLSISGYGGKPASNRFWRQKGLARTLAVVLPGLRYSCDMPLLYYPAQLLLQRGADVLQLLTDYTVKAFQGSTPQEQSAWLSGDARAAVQTAGAQREYARLVLVGKSIGTLAMAQLIEANMGAGAATIWLTPLLHHPQVVEAASACPDPSLFVAGTADPAFDAVAMRRIQDATGAEVLLIEGANHSMEVPGDIFRSLRILAEVMEGIDSFLGTLG